MSADEFYPPRGPADRRLHDPYATQPLPVHEIIDRQLELPPPGGAVALPRATRRRAPNPVGAIILNILAILLVVVLLGAGGALYYLDRTYQGKIYPNISVHGVPVGELTPDEAEAALRARYERFLSQPVTLTYGDRSWQPTPAELGISFDFVGAVAEAYRAGRGNGLIQNLQAILAIWQNGLDLPLRTSFDQRAMQQYVAALRPALEQAPVDAQLILDGTTVRTQPAQIGRQVLVDETVQDLTAALRTFTPQTVVVRTRELRPRLSDAAVADAQARIEAILQGPLTLTVEQKEYVWPVEDLALMLDIARVPVDDATDRIAVELNRYQVERRVRRIADETGRGSVNPRVAWNNGDLQIIKPGKPGVRVDEEQARDLILSAITGQQRVLALPVREVAPQVTEANLHQLGINELVAVGKSDFTGSAAYRIHNIGTGMQILNGILIAPGEEFSFNENIGSIDARNGFVEGYAIIQNRTQLEFGGGICQDSTTLFRAAFWAGLPITERWGHSFYINWYDKYGLGPYGNGPGLDATIFTGGPDLKFVNDTGHWLLLQAWSDPRSGVAQIELYGTKLDRRVEITHRIYDRIPAPTEPVYVADPKQPRGTIKQTDRARGGMTIDVYRTIIENGVRREPELFRTTFKPWPNIYTVNPADLGPDGRPHIQPPSPVPEQPTADPNAQPQPTPVPSNG